MSRTDHGKVHTHASEPVVVDEAAIRDRAEVHGSVTHVERLDGRPGNTVARVRFVDGWPREAYCKLVTDGSDRVTRAAGGAGYARACGVRAPRVLAAELDADPPWLLTARLSGVPLAARWSGADRPARERLLRRVGSHLARLHEVRPSETGRITGFDGHLRTTGESWPATLAATVEERGEALVADRFADAPGRLADAVRTARDALRDGDRALLHGDPNRGNCLVEPLGTLDYERALVGDPAFELVDAVSHLAESPDASRASEAAYREALLAGYRDRAGTLPPGCEQRQPVYRAVAFLTAVQTFHLWAPDAEEPTDELAAWVREEFEERLDAARNVV